MEMENYQTQPILIPADNIRVIRGRRRIFVYLDLLYPYYGYDRQA